MQCNKSYGIIVFVGKEINLFPKMIVSIHDIGRYIKGAVKMEFPSGTKTEVAEKYIDMVYRICVGKLMVYTRRRECLRQYI